MMEVAVNQIEQVIEAQGMSVRWKKIWVPVCPCYCCRSKKRCSRTERSYRAEPDFGPAPARRRRIPTVSAVATSRTMTVVMEEVSEE